MEGVRVANAPVSFGVFELTEGAGGLHDPDELAAAIAAGGYDGIDLGPVGYLGIGAELTGRLARHGLSLAGGFVPMRFADGEAFAADFALLDEALEVFAAAAESGSSMPPPKPTLADAGAPDRHANPGRGKDMPEIRLDDTAWKAFADRVSGAAERVRERGLEPTFHHHACSYVEAPGEVEQLLQLTDVDLCLDTGHLLIGGGDPLDALDRWGERINHLHIKDCHRTIVETVVAERAGMREVWSRGTFCALGSGDLDVAGFLDRVRARGFSGWLVVEQDTIPQPGVELADIAAEQAANRQVLDRHGF